MAEVVAATGAVVEAVVVDKVNLVQFYNLLCVAHFIYHCFILNTGVAKQPSSLTRMGQLNPQMAMANRNFSLKKGFNPQNSGGGGDRIDPELSG